MSGERTEAATPRRLQTLRTEGRVPRSTDLSAAVGLLAACLGLQVFGPPAVARVGDLLVGSFSELHVVAPTAPGSVAGALWAQTALARAGEAWLLGLAPLLAILALIAIGISLAQGIVFAPKALFNWQRVNPLAGLRRLFSLSSFMDLFRAVAKLAIVGVLVTRALLDRFDQLRTLNQGSPLQVAAFLGDAVLSVGLAGAQGLFALAVLDYAYQRWSFARSSRMTKEEVREEHKQQEGDPRLRGQIRARQRRFASMARQLQDVPGAAVVVTNPTHLAVALEYSPSMRAPRVVAKGADLIAERIKQVARDHRVPVVENKPLARGLFAATEVGDAIPLELYTAVAEVLAYVYRLRKRTQRPIPGELG